MFTNMPWLAEHFSKKKKKKRFLPLDAWSPFLVFFLPSFLWKDVPCHFTTCVLLAVVSSFTDVCLS